MFGFSSMQKVYLIRYNCLKVEHQEENEKTCVSSSIRFHLWRSSRKDQIGYLVSASRTSIDKHLRN